MTPLETRESTQIMAEYRRNIAVGITTLAGVAGLLILMMMFGRLPLPGTAQDGYRIRIAMPSAGGLHTESRVNLAGINVGHVESVAFREPPHQGVLVTARIRQSVDIPQGVRAVAFSKPLGGSPTLELHMPQDAQPNQYISKTQPTLIKGQAGGMAQQLAGELKKTLQGELGRFERTAASIEQVTQQWTDVGQHVARLVKPRDADAVDAGEAEANLTTVVERTDRRLKEIGEALAGIQRVVNDDQFIRNLRQTVDNAHEASEKLSTHIDEVSDSITDNADRLTRRYVAAADDLTKAVASMQQLIDQARNGDGTVGQLINDPSLYRNLNDAAARIDAAVVEMKLLVEKWKAEGVPVDFW